jgi:hypothetical protein
MSLSLCVYLSQAVKAMTVFMIGHVWMTNGSSTHGYSFTVTQFDLAQALGPSEKMQPRAIPLPPLEVHMCPCLRVAA